MPATEVVCGVDFVFSDEQEELRRTVRRIAEARSPEATVRSLAESATGHDPETWEVMAGQLGLHGLAIPEEYGGAGASLVELGIVFEELGRSLMCAPFFSTLGLAAGVLVHCADAPSKQRHLPGITRGEIVATLALTEESQSWDLADVRQCTATKGTRGWVLRGSKTFVPDGCHANLILVVARTDTGLGLFTVEDDATGVARTPLNTLDTTRRQARLGFSDTPAMLVAEGPEMVASLEIALAEAGVCLAAEAVGGAQACVTMAVDYANNRFQFGRPIGSFQAVKHRCADMLIAVESARSAAYHGFWVSGDVSGMLQAGPIAKSVCADAYFFAAAQNLQVHGGIGFTWEHPAHLYLRRAKSTQALLGGSAYQRGVLAGRLGLR